MGGSTSSLVKGGTRTRSPNAEVLSRSITPQIGVFGHVVRRGQIIVLGVNSFKFQTGVSSPMLILALDFVLGI